MFDPLRSAKLAQTTGLMEFSIADVTFSVEELSPFKEEALGLFARYAEPSRSSGNQLTLHLLENLPASHKTSEQVISNIRWDWSSKRFTFSKEHAFKGFFTPDQHRADICLNTGLKDKDEKAPSASDVTQELLQWTSLCFNSILRLLVAYELPRLGGLMTHGATVRTERGAVMFLGESGAGKSTISLLAQPREIYSDELSLLSWDETTERFLVRPSPFFGTLEASLQQQVHRCETALPLQAIYFLHQDSSTSIQPAQGIHQNIRRLLTCVTTRAEFIQIQQQVLDTSLRVLNHVPAFDLHFRKEPEVWQHIEEHLSHLEP